MHHPLTSKKKALYLSTIPFLLGLVGLFFLDSWWPAIMLVIGVPVALRQLLLGRSYDAIITLIVFLGAFLTVDFGVSWLIVFPVLFILSAMYLLFREFFGPEDTSEEEEEEELNHEIEEEKK